MFDGVLFFPVTPYTRTGELDLEAFTTHLEQRLDNGPGGVFVACGTGEFHALSLAEHQTLIARAVAVVAGRVPVFAGAGGPLPAAQACAQSAQGAGADGVLVLPPYLVAAPQPGLVAYVRALGQASALPMILYSRDNARFSVASAVELAQLPNVVGYKDGTGDITTLSRTVSAVRHALEPTGRPFAFFNGLPTAEVTMPAYRAMGVAQYSSAVFCFAPEISLAFYDALTHGPTEMMQRLIDEFFFPFVTIRDRVAGYAVSLVKAGVRLRGLEVGGVRPPLVDPSQEDVQELDELIAVTVASLKAIAP
jgi:5-dehydro-4-deoxyglucarate dehydratase